MSGGRESSVIDAALELGWHWDEQESIFYKYSTLFGYRTMRWSVMVNMLRLRKIL